ncbi:MAG: hypothetical protein AMXMBFR84_19960 [Candidatus Hydrogenedentota bacterium]
MSGADFAKLAGKIDLFKGLHPEEVKKIFAKGMTMTVPKGDVVFYQGTTGNTMYVVLGGKIDLYDHKRFIASLRSGDTFGEMALINHEPRSATAVASETSHLFAMNETTFDKLMTKSVAIRILLNIVGLMSSRLKNMNGQLTKLKVLLEQKAEQKEGAPQS